MGSRVNDALARRLSSARPRGAVKQNEGSTKIRVDTGIGGDTARIEAAPRVDRAMRDPSATLHFTDDFLVVFQVFRVADRGRSRLEGTFLLGEVDNIRVEAPGMVPIDEILVMRGRWSLTVKFLLMPSCRSRPT